MTGEKGEAIFREEQRVAETGWVLLVYLAALAAWGSLLAQVVFGWPGKRRQPLWLSGLLVFVFGVIFPLLFRDSRLVVEVDEDGVVLRYHPFHRRPHRVDAAEILSARAVTYHPLQEFGGWGIRLGLGRRKAYTVSGNRGVELELSSGWRLLVGSRRPEELLSAVRKITEMEKQPR